MNPITQIWHRLFLEERPSIGLSLFRIAVALTTGFHVLPSFFHLADNYYPSALKTLNFHFFPGWVIDLVQQSSLGVIHFFVFLFCVSCLFFLVGLYSQISCILMTIGGYYFYALNSFHIGTLSWDILLVTLFLMCVTPYHGDYFSLDALRIGNPSAYKTRRPFFLQRLLQMQVAFTYFYTALYKVGGAGNWITGNPIYNLMHYPQMGVTKYFLIRDFMAQHPGLCYWTGIAIVVTELAMPFLLFYPKTRISALYLGVVFHIVLILTLDVPAIFFFLFPAQLLLFIHPNNVIAWIEKKRQYNEGCRRSQLIYDGNCQFCRASVQKLLVLDLFSTLEMVDYNKYDDVKTLHPKLTQKIAHSQIHLIEPDGGLYGGFEVFRRICFTMPIVYPLIPIVYFPGSGILGPLAYRFIAKNRYLLHSHKRCKDNVCFR